LAGAPITQTPYAASEDLATETLREQQSCFQIGFKGSLKEVSGLVTMRGNLLNRTGDRKGRAWYV